MNAAKETVVSFHYTLKNKEGETIDSSENQDPLAYLHGANNIIPGLEREIDGKSAGDQFEVKVEPKDAYGDRNDQLVRAIPLSQFENLDQIKPGVQLQINSPQGAQRAIVLKVEPENVLIDLNHPLAGETLHFEVKIEDVREATKEEVEHGHVHGPHGHAH